jgi:hypothetical protein
MTYTTPKSPVLNEHWNTGGFLVSEANGALSRQASTYVNATASDALLDAGLVVTEVNLGTATITATAGNTGNATLASLTLGGAVQAGDYVVKMTAATTFSVTRPDGAVLGTGTLGTAFSSPEIGFTGTAGTTACVAGDSFTIQVNPGDIGTQSWTGTGVPSGILFNRTVIPANSSGPVTLIARAAEVNFSELQWDAAVLASASVVTLQSLARDALFDLGIIAR